jgi:RAMP superfamily
MSPTEHLLEEEVWRLEVLAPLHAGSGEQLTKGLDVESTEGWTFAVDVEKLLATLPPGKRDRVGVDGLRDLCGSQPLRDVQRYAMPGEVHGPRFPEHGPATLRCFARDGFGRPFLPGSTLKGALRTALLNAVAEKDGAVQAALRAAAHGGGRSNGKDADLRAQQAAFRVDGSADSVDDVLRHLHVPDVPLPPASVEVVEVKMASMDGRGGWGWKRGPRDNNALDPSERGVLALYVEAVCAGTVLRVPLRLDARRLRQAKDQDFSRWTKVLLDGGLLAAARAHGERVLGPEVTLWTRSRVIDAVGRAAAGLVARAKDGEAVFPVGWGIGWRGMTGAALERLDGDAARQMDANVEDTALITAARGTYPRLSKGEFEVFPKSRRLWMDAKTGEPRGPLGWVAVRAWGADDVATAFEPVKAPEGRSSRAAFAPRQAPGERRAVAPAPAVVAAGAKPGDAVRGTLTGKSPKGKWKVTLLRPVVAGTVVEGDAPEGAAVGAEVDLVVKTASLGGQDWQLAWPAKKA